MSDRISEAPDRSAPSGGGGIPAEHERTSRFALSAMEARALPWLADRLPRHVVPDHMTLLGVLASVGIAVSYMLTNRDPAWLWAASGFLVVQWLGDSLDGTLARRRGIERPRYGFYLDHLVDAFSTLAIGLGLGLSPYMLLSVGLAIVIAYHMLSINVYLETHVYGEFAFGYAWLGPTEARVVLIGLDTLALTVGPLPFGVAGRGATVFDVAGVAAALGMLVLLGVRVVANLRRLARLEPPRGGSP
ncbi:MAG TPA: CDP-alcohol phosphatidyltransferase family protein [Gemmatimonadota bacterium]|nr:CDP-alcohol phosphatidyltransferase family protein [Gemmatimonadota bacterium]